MSSFQVAARPLHRPAPARFATRARSADAIGAHIAAELRRGRPLIDVLSDVRLYRHLDGEGRARAVTS